MDFMADGPGGIDSSIAEKEQAMCVPWLANYAFAASYPTITPLPEGRVMGWTDWTHGGRTRYGGGGGGCPFADARTASGWQVENSLLARSLSAELSIDTYRLKAAPAEVNGGYQVRLRENEQEHTSLDQVQLVAVDHAPEVRAFALDDRIVLGNTVPAYRVTTASGADVTAQVSGSEPFFAGQRGDTLLVQIEAPRDSRIFGGDPVDSLAGAVILAIQPMKKIVYGMLPPISGVTGGLDAAPAGISDALVLGSTGILVQVPDAAGGWRTVQHRYPRELWDDFLVDSLAPGPVRLVFLSRHDLRFVGKFIPAGESAVPVPLELRSARHSRLGDVRPPVLARDQQTTALTPGDTLSLEFAASPATKGRDRAWFLLSTGVYTSLAPFTRQQPAIAHLPGQLALRQNQPNPFSRITS